MKQTRAQLIPFGSWSICFWGALSGIDVILQVKIMIGQESTDMGGRQPEQVVLQPTASAHSVWPLLLRAAACRKAHDKTRRLKVI